MNEIKQFQEEELIDLKSNEVGEKVSLLKKFAIMVLVISVVMLSISIFGIAIHYLLIWVKVPTIISALIASQLSVLILGFIFYECKLHKMIKPFKTKITGESIFQALKATMFILIVNILIGSILKTDGKTSSTVDNLMNETSFMTSMFLPIIIAPLFEEITFRSGLKYVLIDKYKFHKISYIIITGMIFGSLHYSPDALGVTQVALTSVMGMIYAYYYIKTDNIYVSMLSHLLYNGLVMTTAYMVR